MLGQLPHQHAVAEQRHHDVDGGVDGDGDLPAVPELLVLLDGGGVVDLHVPLCPLYKVQLMDG